VLSPHADRRPANHPSLRSQPRITWMRTKVHTPYGAIHSAWRCDSKGHYEYVFTLPRSVTYEIKIPDLTPEDKVKVHVK
jgi:hypothetical protein